MFKDEGNYQLFGLSQCLKIKGEISAKLKNIKVYL